MTVDPLMGEADSAAAELALGVLDGEERAAAIRRVLAEPEFARDVERWRDRFGLLFSAVPGVLVPDGVFEQVERRIDGVGITAPARQAGNIWKPAVLAASVAALAMAAVAVRTVEPAPAPAQTAPMIAAMAPADKSAAQPAIYDAASGLVKMPGPMTIPTGRSAQLWAIEAGKPPKPLGTFHAAGPGMYAAEARMGAVIAPGTTLAISIEPVGGSPTGSPTGPVIASGMLTKV